jgi:hypothetical protein
MTESTQPPPAEAPKTFWQKASRWVIGIAGVILMISGLLKLAPVLFPSLPSCSSDSATNVVRSIFKQKNVELTKLGDIKTVTDTSAEKTCEGQVETPTERATIWYRVYWRDRDVMVMITKVDAKPR